MKMNKRFSMIMIAAFLFCLLPLSANADIIIQNPHGSTIGYGTSWDTPPLNLEQVLAGLDLNGDGDIHLTVVNGFVGETESWFGSGAVSVILEEIAGYADATTFGWYNTANIASYGQLFAGSDSTGAEASVVFNPAIEFGFYIDPNGIQGDRMYTQHLLNVDNSYQVVIFAIDELPGQFILGWEDLLLSGDSDRDYQDMIVRVSIVGAPESVPEPGTLLLMLLGLTGLAGVAYRRKATGHTDSLAAAA